MRVIFTKDFDWYPPELKGRSHIAYKAGMNLLVRKNCAADAMKARAAKPITEKEHSDAKHTE